MTDSHVGLSMASGEGKSVLAAHMLAGHTEWTAVPGYYCEVTDGQPVGNGQVRSIDRIVLAGGARCAGADPCRSGLYHPRLPAGRTCTTTQGNRQTIEVHSLMMLAYEGPCPPGKQVRHYNDVSTDNRWAPGGEANCGPGKPGQLVYGTPKENIADGMRNNPPAPKLPPRLCEPHGNRVTQGSKTRCHECVTEMGRDGAELLRMGYSPEDAAAELDYASPGGLVKLAVKYGGYQPPRTDVRPRVSRTVMGAVRSWLRRKAPKCPRVTFS